MIGYLRRLTSCQSMIVFAKPVVQIDHGDLPRLPAQATDLRADHEIYFEVF